LLSTSGWHHCLRSSLPCSIDVAPPPRLLAAQPCHSTPFLLLMADYNTGPSYRPSIISYSPRAVLCVRSDFCDFCGNKKCRNVLGKILRKREQKGSPISCGLRLYYAPISHRSHSLTGHPPPPHYGYRSRMHGMMQSLHGGSGFRIWAHKLSLLIGGCRQCIILPPNLPSCPRASASRAVIWQVSSHSHTLSGKPLK